MTNYIDDSGLQIADIVVGFQYAKFPIDPSDKTVKFDRYCGDEIYVKVNNLYKVDSSLLKIRTEILRQLETDANEVSSFASKITRKVLESQLKTCWRVKSRYDLLTFESHILHSNLWQQLFQILKTRGIIEYRSQGKNAGCWVYVPKDGSDEKVIVRSDGTATYIAKDICFAGLKMGLVKDPLKYSIYYSQWDDTDLWTTTIFDKNLDEGMFQKIHNPVGSSSIQKYFFPGDLAITLIDERQKRLQNIIEEILDRIASHGSKYLGLSYGTVTLSAKTARQLNLQIDSTAESVNMSGRSGITVNADFVLDLLFDRAKQAARERNPSLSGEELDKIAGDIAVSAARYNLLKYDVEKIVKFDLEDSISLEGDSGPYIQYTHARICSLVDKSQLNDKMDYEMTDIKHVSEALEMREERDLFRQLSKFEISVSEAVRNYEPKILTIYLHKLATLFNIYYEKIPIAKERDLRLAQARILLSMAVRIVISSGLSVLGMSPLERM
ncbi:MAG: DALR anticodon-binding domain-containing protein [Candidatus Eiseniibacteriota bacterium]